MNKCYYIDHWKSDKVPSAPKTDNYSPFRFKVRQLKRPNSPPPLHGHSLRSNSDIGSAASSSIQVYLMFTIFHHFN